MEPKEKITVFEVKHCGRGGDIFIHYCEKIISGSIEMFPTGSFAVSFPRLDKKTKDLLRPLLRKWLDESNRSNWFIEN